MADTTAIYGWPYQEAGDPPDGAGLGQDLAEAIETTVDTIDDRVDAAEARLTAVEAGVTQHACKLVQQSAQSIPDGSDTVVLFGSGSEEFDTDGWHSTSVNTGRITVDRTGLFQVDAHLTYAFSTALEYADVAIRLNGTASWRSGNMAPTTTNNVSKNGGSMTETIAATSGDYFEMSALQNSTANASRDTNTGGAGTRFTVRYLGPT